MKALIITVLAVVLLALLLIGLAIREDTGAQSLSSLDRPSAAEENVRSAEDRDGSGRFRRELLSDEPVMTGSRSPLLAATAGEAMDRLIETEPWGAASALYFQSQWLEVCDLEARAARMQSEMRLHLGFDDSMLNELMDFCVGALPASMDITDSTDRLALRELAEEMMMDDSNSLALASEQLEGTRHKERKVLIRR